MASRPVALPEIFNGEGSWTDWLDHFESVADVNEWDAATKKKWIRARLTGRAATALRKLPDDDRETFAKITAALKKRFEPECKKEVYMAEFQAKRKKKTEDWASFGEDLKILVEKAYPTLQAEAQELLALNQFLSQLEDSQLSFGVRQRNPKTVDEAVSATLELETYLRPGKTLMTAVVTGSVDDGVAGVSRSTQESSSPLQQVLDRLERIESQLQAKDGGGSRWEGSGSGNRSKEGGYSRRRNPQRNIVCWNCKGEGHISRNCLKRSKDQGNETPLEQ